MTVTAGTVPTEKPRISWTTFGEESEAEGSLIFVQQAGGFFIAVSYVDVNGGQETVTRLHVQWREGEGWRASQTELFDAGADAPLASSGIAE